MLAKIHDNFLDRLVYHRDSLTDTTFKSEAIALIMIEQQAKNIVIIIVTKRKSVKVKKTMDRKTTAKMIHIFELLGQFHLLPS